jgi:hypothetical protein
VRRRSFLRYLAEAESPEWNGFAASLARPLRLIDGWWVGAWPCLMFRWGYRVRIVGPFVGIRGK